MKINVAALARKPKSYFETTLAVEAGVSFPFRFAKRDGLTPYRVREIAPDLTQRFLEEGEPFPTYGPGSDEIEITDAMI